MCVVILENGYETGSHIGLKEALFFSFTLIPDLHAIPSFPHLSSRCPFFFFTLQTLQLNCVFKVQAGTWKECSARIRFMERKIMIKKNTHARLISRSTVSSHNIMNAIFSAARPTGFLPLFLLQAWSSLHPECELIFQLQEEERSCLQHIAQQGNQTSEGSCVFFLP